MVSRIAEHHDLFDDVRLPPTKRPRLEMRRVLVERGTCIICGEVVEVLPPG
jgi:hypothetical protein